jgi:hypothetical protein
MTLFKLCFYVPTGNVEAVKSAVFVAGAGRIGNYDCCAWQVLGEGQFRPLAGSNPHIGQLDQIERVAEYRVEMVCEEACLAAALTALRTAHPYEEPAIDVWRLVSL